MVIYEEMFWPKVCASLGQPRLAADPRFDTADKREQNCRQLVRILDGLFAELAVSADRMPSFLPFAVRQAHRCEAVRLTPARGAVPCELEVLERPEDDRDSGGSKARALRKGLRIRGRERCSRSTRSRPPEHDGALFAPVLDSGRLPHWRTSFGV